MKIDKNIIESSRVRYGLYKILEDFKNIKELDNIVLRDLKYYLVDKDVFEYSKKLFNNDRLFKRLNRYLNAIVFCQKILYTNTQRGFGLDEVILEWNCCYGENVVEAENYAKNTNKRFIFFW